MQLALRVHRLGLPDLVREVHRLEQDRPLVLAQRGQVLLLADHDLRDRHLPRLVERFREQPVRLLGAVLGHEVIRLPEVDRVDLVEIDEVADVDRVRELDVEAVDVLVGQLDVPALLDLEPANDVLGVDVLAGVLSDLVVADWHQVVLVEKVKLQLLRLRGRVHLHRDADEAERDRPAPDRSHGPSVPRAASRGTSKRGLRSSRRGTSGSKRYEEPLQSFSTQRGVGRRGRRQAGLDIFTTRLQVGENLVDGVDTGQGADSAAPTIRTCGLCPCVRRNRRVGRMKGARERLQGAGSAAPAIRTCGSDRASA